MKFRGSSATRRRVGLYLGFPPEGGGAFQYAQSVLEATHSLPALKYEVVVYYTHPAWEPRLEKYANRMKTVTFRSNWLDVFLEYGLRFGVPLGIYRRLARNIHPLARRLLHENCDLWIFPAQEVWTYALPVRTLGVIHDLMHRYEPTFPEVSKLGLFRRRERHYQRLCNYARGILVDSEVGKTHVLESYQVEPQKIFVLPFVPPPYVYEKENSREFDERYSLPEKFIFYPAQFWHHKNHVRLITAMAAVRPVLPDLHLVLVGAKKDAYAEVMHAIHELELTDRVHIFGYVPDEDLVTFYRRARALVMPTFFGPTNIPPLEAMALGCPVGASNVYAMPEQIGEAGLLFDPKSVLQIAETIFKLASNDQLCDRLSNAGKARVANWTQDHFNKRFEIIIESLVG